MIPTKITEERLLGLGFKHFADGQLEKCNLNLCFNWDKDIGLFLFIEDSESHISFEHIKLEHELQDLYFALTGEELKQKQ